MTNSSTSGVGRLGLLLRLSILLLLVWIPLCNLVPRHGEPGALARWLIDPFRLPVPEAQLASIVISRDLPIGEAGRRLPEHAAIRSHQSLLLPARLRDYDLTMTVVLTDSEPLDIVLREWERPGRAARWSALRLTPFLGGVPWFTSRERLPDPSEAGFRTGADAPTDVRISVRGDRAHATVGWQPVPGAGTLLDPQGQIGFVGSGEVKELRVIPVREPMPALQLLAAAATVLLCLFLAVRTAGPCRGLRRAGEVSLAFLFAEGTLLWAAHRVTWLFLPGWLHFVAAGGSVLTALLLLGTAGTLRRGLFACALPAVLALLHTDRGLAGHPAADAWRSPTEQRVELQYGQLEANRSLGAFARQFADRHAVHRHDPAARSPKVVFLGGSQTFAEDLRPELAFPLVAAGTLRGRHSRDVETVVAAARGASTIQQLSLFREQLLFLEPRVVVLCASAHDPEPSAHAPDADELQRLNLLLPEPATPPWWSRSALASLLPSLLGASDRARHGPPRVGPESLRTALAGLATLAGSLRFHVVLAFESSRDPAAALELHRVLREAASANGWAVVDWTADAPAGAAGLLDERGHQQAAAALVPAMLAGFKE
jgi:hypothetical protein